MFGPPMQIKVIKTHVGQSDSTSSNCGCNRPYLTNTSL